MNPLKNLSAAVGELKKNNLPKSVDSSERNKPQKPEAEAKVKADKAQISEDARQMLHIRDKAFELFKELNGRSTQVDPSRLEAIRSNIINEVYQDEEYTELLAERISNFLDAGDV